MSRAFGWAGALLVGAAAIYCSVLDRLGLTTREPFQQLIAFRGLLGIASVVLALLLAFTAALGRRPLSHRAPTLFLAATLLGTGMVHVGITAGRGVVNDPPSGPTPPPSLTVIALNTLDGAAPPEAVADVALDVEADVVALPETPIETAQLVADLLAAGGRPMQVFSDDHGPRHRATSLLVSAELGTYRETMRGNGSVRVDSVDGQGPPIVSVHASRPGKSSLEEWQAEVRAAVETCDLSPGAVVAGDFNATLDHEPMQDLGRCVDAAAASGPAGAGGHGTWPSFVPSVFGAAIDHVLVDGEYWRVVGAGVATIGASDHRAVITRIEPR